MANYPSFETREQLIAEICRVDAAWEDEDLTQHTHQQLENLLDYCLNDEGNPNGNCFVPTEYD
jgi:hypothetical protein